LANFLTPLGMYGPLAAYSVILGSAILVAWRISGSLKGRALAAILGQSRRIDPLDIALGTLIGISLTVRFAAITGLYAFSEADIMTHSFITSSIINQHALSLYSPYGFASSSIGFETVAAFFSFITGIPAEQSVTITTQLFSVMLILATYIIAYSISKDKLVGLFSSVILFLAYFPMGNTWGGDPEVLGFFIFSVLIALIFMNPLGSSKLPLVLLLGTLIAVDPLGLLTVGAFLIVYIPYRALAGWTLTKVFGCLRQSALILVGVILVVPMSFIQILPTVLVSVYGTSADDTYLWRVFDFSYGVLPGIPKALPPAASSSNSFASALPRSLIFGLPFTLGQMRSVVAMWYDRGGLYVDFPPPFPPVYYILVLGLAFTCLVLFVSIYSKSLRIRLRKHAGSALFALFWYLTLVLFEQANPYGVLPAVYPLSTNPDKIVALSVLPLGVIIGYWFSLSIKSIGHEFAALRNQIHSRAKFVRKKEAALGVAVLILSSVFLVGGGYIAVEGGQSRAQNFIYDVHQGSLLSGDDYSLMVWMKANLSSNAVILINPADAGGFIPTVSGLKVVAFGSNENDPLYQYILKEMLVNPNDSLMLAYMGELSVSYVYIGAVRNYTVTGEAWNPSLLLHSPYYAVYKQIGDAWLFRVSYPQY